MFSENLNRIPVHDSKSYCNTSRRIVTGEHLGSRPGVFCYSDLALEEIS
jgi:hypothetical protein